MNKNIKVLPIIALTLILGACNSNNSGYNDEEDESEESLEMDKEDISSWRTISNNKAKNVLRGILNHEGNQTNAFYYSDCSYDDVCGVSYPDEYKYNIEQVGYTKEFVNENNTYSFEYGETTDCYISVPNKMRYTKTYNNLDRTDVKNYEWSYYDEQEGKGKLIRKDKGGNQGIGDYPLLNNCAEYPTRIHAIGLMKDTFEALNDIFYDQCYFDYFYGSLQNKETDLNSTFTAKKYDESNIYIELKYACTKYKGVNSNNELMDWSGYQSFKLLINDYRLVSYVTDENLICEISTYNSQSGKYEYSKTKKITDTTAITFSEGFDGFESTVGKIN